MCSKVLNGHIILTDTSITTILAPEMTYTPNIMSGANVVQNVNEKSQPIDNQLRFYSCVPRTRLELART